MRRAIDNLPRVSGVIKVVPEDFVVEEIGDGQPDGEGPHLLLWVEKRGRDTHEVVQEIASSLRVPTREVGVAGQKDRQAVTRQWISVPAHALSGFESSTSSNLPGGRGWRILSAHRHGAKLRTGRLLGNRFRIRLRGGGRDAETAQAALLDLARSGVPNFFGVQRFGRRGDNADHGLAIVRGQSDERRGFKRRMFISALQALLFNEWLDARFDDGLLNAAVSGDLLRDRPGFGDPYVGDEGLRLSEEPEADSPKVAMSRVDPTGPIFGAYMRSPMGEAAKRESDILQSAGLCLEDFRDLEKDAPGSRRPARAWLEGVSVETDGEDSILCFDLERGAYATIVLAQLGVAV